MSINRKEIGINCLYFLGLFIEAVFITAMGVAIVAQGFDGVPKMGYNIIPLVGLVFLVLCIIYIYSVWIIKPSYKKFSNL